MNMRILDEPTTVEVTEKLDSLAAAMGGRFEGGERGGTGIVAGKIILSNDVQFWVAVGGYANEGRIRVSCAYPQHETSDGYLRATTQRDFDPTSWLVAGAGVHQPITASFAKPIKTLAGDIERRYLTRYRTLYAQAVEWCEAQRLYFFNKRATLSAVQHSLEKCRPVDSDRGFYASILHVGSLKADIGLYELTVDQVLALEKFLSTL
jgi:hypothetical protein